MTLGFSTVINGQPTNFVERIWACLLKIDRDLYADYLHPDGRPNDLKPASYYEQYKPKLHTLRVDAKARWRAGLDIHAVIGNRTPKRCQFAPIFKCVSVQAVSINYDAYNEGTYYVAGWIASPVVTIDGRTLMEHEVEELAINDGFDDINDFLRCFNGDWSGRLIHWTNLKY